MDFCYVYEGFDVFYFIYVLIMDWFNDLYCMNVVMLDQHNDFSDKFR